MNIRYGQYKTRGNIKEQNGFQMVVTDDFVLLARNYDSTTRSTCGSRGKVVLTQSKESLDMSAVVLDWEASGSECTDSRFWKVFLS